MSSLSKKLAAALLAATAAVCLFVGLFAVQQHAFAAESKKLNDIKFFNCEQLSDGYAVTGLSAEGVSEIGDGNFEIDFTGLNVVRIGAEGATESFLTTAKAGKLTAVTFGSELTEISAYAFYRCTALTDIDLSGAASLTKIGANAFNAYSSSSTASITIPEGVTSIGSLAFANHTNLTAINFYATDCADFGTSTTTVTADSKAAANNPFYRAGYISGNAKDIVVNIGSAGGSAVNSVPAYMFYNIPANPNKIKKVNFVNVSADAKFGDYAFANCTSLTNVDFGKVAVIGRYAFSQCTALAGINVPSTVTTIDRGAFNGCTKLSGVYWDSNMQLEVIGQQAFESCSALTSFTIPSSVKNINGNAFNLSGLTSITIPENVASIGSGAFGKCANLATVNYNAIHATGVLSSPFDGSGSASGIEVYIGKGTTSKINYIHRSLFKNTNITKVEINNVEISMSLGDEVFRNCNSLTSVKFSSSCNIKSLGTSAFEGCTALQTVILPNGLTEIGEQTFYNCSSLYSISESGNGIAVPSGVTAIGAKAFSGCSSIFSLSLPVTVESIGEQAFYNCISLLEVRDLSNLHITEGSTDNGHAGYYAKHIYSSGSSYITTNQESGYVIYNDSSNKYLLGYVGDNTELNLADITGEFEIYTGAFKGNLVIEKVNIPSNATKLGQEAFSGCAALKEITISSNINEFGTAVFYGCVSLTGVELPEGISIIPASMFENCSALRSINIPSTVTTIGASAFKGCSQLRTVNFKEHKADGIVSEDSGYMLTKIDANAFNGCSFLTVINIPETVTSMGGYVFNDCTRLATVYLPAALGNYNSANMFSGCSNNLLLIAPADNYVNYKNALSSYGNVTYIVKVNLIYGEESAVQGTTERLFDPDGHFGYNYVKQSDGSWSTAGGVMPVQEGYSASVWYTNGSYAEEVTGAKLSQMLGVSNVKTVNLYAKLTAYPDFVVIDSQEYDESRSWSAAEVLTGYDETQYSAVVVSYTSISGKKTENPETMKDAGDYVIEIKIKEPEKFGVWEQNDNLFYTFTVRTKRQDVTQFINFVTSSGTALASTDSSNTEAGAYLYLYGNKDNGLVYPYLKEQIRDDAYVPAGATSNAISVTNSYLIYNGSASVVSLASNAANNKFFTVIQYATESTGSEVVMSGDSYVGVKATEHGTYEMEVTLLANNNYTLEYGSNSTGGLGLFWTPANSSNGYTYTITKTWYIAMTDGNTLLNADKTAFSLPTLSQDNLFGWTYGDETVKEKLSAPTLAGTPDEAADLVTFVLSNIEIWGNKNYTFGLNDYEKVINYTMPAGYYFLSATVKPTGSYGGENYDKIAFEVVKADYSGKLAEWKIDAIYGDLYTNSADGKSFTVEYNNGAVQFADTSSLKILDLGVDDIYAREGIWADDEYNQCYKTFEISYNTDGLSSYYSGNFSGMPAARGKYTVYFNLTSSNYKSLVDVTQETERKTYCYTLYIKETIDADLIDLGSAVYSGSAVKFESTDFYKFVYLNGEDEDSKNVNSIIGKTDDYVNAGKHTVALTIRTDRVDSYRWKEGNNIKIFRSGENVKEYVFLDFEIARAENQTTQWLNIREWTKFEYSSTANRPQWATKFVTEYSDFTFRLQNVKDSTEVYFYAPKNNGELSFNDAPAGEYKLIATAAGGEGYNWNALNVEFENTVTVKKATLTLKNEPYIAGWKYGEYKESYKAPVYSFPDNFEGLETKYYIVTAQQYNQYIAGAITWEAMKKYADIEYMLDEAYNEVPVGDYVYVIELADGVKLNENFEEWSFAIHFSVVQVRNYWKTTPSVHDWYYGDYTNRDTTIDYEPYYGSKGEVVLSFRRVDENHAPMSGWVTDISKLEFDSNGELGAGYYEIRAFLQGNGNYSNLELTNSFFIVEKAYNSWTSDGVPVVKSWSQGNWDAKENALTAKANWGDVEFSVYKASDTQRENSYDISKLNSLGVGSYVLVARVAGTADYEELVSESTFAVFEDSVGMTGLIAATMVFAVIAIGLAISGVVLLILRNKKIEEEFRRMIKSELRRK